MKKESSQQEKSAETGRLNFELSYSHAYLSKLPAGTVAGVLFNILIAYSIIPNTPGVCKRISSIYAGLRRLCVAYMAEKWA